ncbi:uncharacterized protein LOC117532224 [Tachysurus ichikawai]
MVLFVENLLHGGLELTEDMPDLQIERAHREYSEIRKVLKEKKVPFQTLFPARLHVRHDDGTKTYDTIEEASEDLRRRGYTVTITRPPETLVEQMQRLSWSRVDRRARKDTLKAGREACYREKLRTFRRPSPAPSGI